MKVVKLNRAHYFLTDPRMLIIFQSAINLVFFGFVSFIFDKLAPTP